MKNALLAAGLVALALALTGCVGLRGDAHAFQNVDISRDLDAATIARYEREWQQLSAAGNANAMMTRLEHSDWRLLGFLAYWPRGSVMRTSSGGNVHYNVAKTLGVGPFSCLYGAQTHATFDAKGKRLASMSMGTVLWGHLAMFHKDDALLANGQKKKSLSLHLLMHLLYINVGDAGTSVSLFTMPNPVGVQAH